MRKNILILAHNYGIQFIEGCNQYAQLFDKTQYSVTVAYLIGAEDAVVKQKTEAEKIIFLNLPSKAIRGLKISAIKKILAMCREQQFEMVFCHRYKPTYIMMWVALFVRIPRLFFIMHALETMRAYSRRLITACLYRENMTFIGVSNAVREDLRHDMWRVPASHITSYYNILDYELFEPQLYTAQQARELLKLPPEAFVFGTIGRLVKEKDQQTLILAFSEIKPFCPGIKLVLMGDGKLETDLKQLAAKLNLSEDIIFTGFIPDGFRYMKAFNIFVLNSVEEAFGRVLLEAMVAYTPIIASRADGIPEVVGDAGFVVTAKNPRELATVMQHTYSLSATELTAIGNKAYQRLVDTFSIQRFKQLFWETIS